MYINNSPYVFSSDDLTGFDRTVKCNYQGKKGHVFGDEMDRWKYSDFYTRHIPVANDVVSKILIKLMNGE